jgi:hypothetical protein
MVSSQSQPMVHPTWTPTLPPLPQLPSNPPFVVPGQSLAFFPVGLVVTSIWTAGFFIAVGGGTYGRIQFREQYRRRVRTEAARGVRTI